MSSPGATRAFLSLLLVAGIIGAGYVFYWNRPSMTAPASRAATSLPVAVARVTRGAFEVRAVTIGTVSVDASVQVKSRVDGQVIEADFAEGQIVQKGDLLFRLDPALFRAQLRQAEAALARDQAQLANAQADQKRFTNLAKQGFATAQQQEQASAQTKVLTAALAADQAAIDIARLQLSYTEIRAPLDGKTGRILIRPGNLVKADNGTALVVINQLQPIAVDFALPQQDLPSLQRRLAAGKLKVLVGIPGDPRPRLRGKVDFINNAVDAASGTITLKAVFDNADLRLLPAQQVDVSILLQTIDDALTVPSEAVNEGQNGQYVYALAADGTAALVPVKVSHEEGGRSVIDGNLKPGDKVVIDGQLRLGPGAKVTIKSDGA